MGENVWIPLKDVDFGDQKLIRFNIDTRDWCVGVMDIDDIHPDFATIKKYNRFFHTEEELKELLDRYFKESHGETGTWRMFSLDHTDSRVTGWNFKYIRIWRTELGFVVCNSQNKAIGKDILAAHVSQEYLCHH